MKVLVTGSTGFTGSYVVPLLIERGYSVRCLVRPTSNQSILPEKVKCIIGDLDDFSSIVKAADGVDALVNVASIGFGHAPQIVRAVSECGVKRAVFISTTAIFTRLNAESKIIRKEAEKAIAQSGLDWTVLRPTMIYGNPGDRNMARLIKFLKKWPVFPVIGNGRCLQQPVYVGDVAKAVVNCLEKETTFRKAYNIPGAEPVSFNQVIDTIADILNRRIRKIHLPFRPILTTLRVLEKTGRALPIKAEQIERLNEDKVFDYKEASKDFAYAPLSFSQGITLEIEEMR